MTGQLRAWAEERSIADARDVEPEPWDAGRLEARRLDHGDVLAIDPGSELSAYVLLCPEEAGPGPARVVAHGKVANADLLDACRRGELPGGYWIGGIRAAVLEYTAPRGMPASAQLFATLVWLGRYQEALDNRWRQYANEGGSVELLGRDQVKLWHLGRRAGTDAQISANLVDLYGGVGGRRAAVGVKASPGPLFGIRADEWQALALGVAWLGGAR